MIALLNDPTKLTELIGLIGAYAAAFALREWDRRREMRQHATTTTTEEN